MGFKNLDELYDLFRDPAEQVIDYICAKIIDEININLVQQGIGLRGNFYEPTGQFYEAWKQGITENVGKLIRGSVGYDSDGMMCVPDAFIHGSNYWSGGDDVRDILPDLIFGGKSGGIFGQGFWTDERDAWSPTIAKIDASFDKWVKEGFRQAGVKVI